MGVFTERAERLVEGIAKQAAIAIDNARLFDASREAAEPGQKKAKSASVPSLKQRRNASSWLHADGTLLHMNSVGLSMVQADSSEAVIGKCVYDLIAPEDRERYREFNERICRGERASTEFDIVGLKGRRRHMETHAAPLQTPMGLACNWQ